MPESLNAEPGAAVPSIGGSAPPLSDEDETVEMDDLMADQPEPEIFELTSPDPCRGPIRDTDNTA